MHPHGATLQNSSRSSRHPWMAHRKILRLAAQLARIRPESQDVKEDVTRALTANGVMKAKQGSHLPIFWLLNDLIREDNTSESHKFESFSLGQGTILFYRASFAWHFLGVHPINRPPEDRVLKVWWSKKGWEKPCATLPPKQNTHKCCIQNNRHCCPLKSFATPLFFLCD